MMTFWVLAIGLGIAAFAFVCLPAYFYRQPVEGESTGTSLDDPSGSIRTGVNVSIYQEREAEYKETLDQNLISQDEYTQLINELKRNLIQEAGEDNDPSAANPALGRLPLVLAVLVPLFAVFAYSEFGFSWGSIDDVQVMEELRASDPRDKIAMRASIEKLADRMKGQPDNWEGWFLLAQSYQNLGINEEAAAAYRHLITKFPRDPGLSSYYTETLYLADDRNMTPRVEEAMERTLSLNPADATMLEIKAMSLYQKGELRASVTEFRKALATGLDAERAELIKGAISKIETDIASGGPGSKAESNTPADVESASDGRQLQVLVEVAESVDVDADAEVFVFARAIGGPPMPLAIQKLARSDLPGLVMLDEKMAMIQGMGLADFDEVQVVARISASGGADISPEDFEIVSSPIDMTKENPVIKLEIETKRKNQ